MLNLKKLTIMILLQAQAALISGNSIELTKNVTFLLNQLLKGYDKRLRPYYGSKPLEVFNSLKNLKNKIKF